MAYEQTSVEEIRFCKHCEKPITRKRLPCGRMETSKQFKKRVYCDNTCRGLAVRTDTSNQWSLLSRSRKFRKKVCEKCGGNERISIHHKDRDRSNNSPGNLMTLCNRCHRTLHYEEDGPIPNHRPKQKCIICGKPVVGKGLCNKHYTRQCRNGSPFIKFCELTKLYEIVED